MVYDEEKNQNKIKLLKINRTFNLEKKSKISSSATTKIIKKLLFKI